MRFECCLGSENGTQNLGPGDFVCAGSCRGDGRCAKRKFSNFDFFFLNILPLKEDESLGMSGMLKKMGGHRLRFGENRRTPKTE